MIPSAEWFVILRGPNQGTIHMAGWSMSAHLGTPMGGSDDGWLAFATCPRCAAMVVNSENRRDGFISREIIFHNNWHSMTDHPIPPEVTAEQNRMYQAMSRLEA